MSYTQNQKAMTKELAAVEKEVCDQLQLLNLDIVTETRRELATQTRSIEQ
jgi:hypothetical protein